jgi:hypothetical protein
MCDRDSKIGFRGADDFERRGTRSTARDGGKLRKGDMEPQELDNRNDFASQPGVEYLRVTTFFPDKVRLPAPTPRPQEKGLLGRVGGLLGGKKTPRATTLPLTRVMPGTPPDSVMTATTRFTHAEWEDLKNAQEALAPMPARDSVHHRLVLESEGYTLVARWTGPHVETLYFARFAADAARPDTAPTS